MSATVWKFPLAFPTLDREGVTMPAGARVLHVAVQDSGITVWALVDPEFEPAIRHFAVVGTGHAAPTIDEGRHVGTVFDGPFVWHVFEMAS